MIKPIIFILASSVIVACDTNDSTGSSEDCVETANDGDTVNSVEECDPDVESEPLGDEVLEMPNEIVAAKLTAENCIDPDLAKLAKDEELMLCNGSIGKGIYEESEKPDLAGLVASNIKSGVTINGVLGTYSVSAPVSCTADGEQNCVVSGNFKSTEISGLADKVLSSASVAGIGGNVTLPVEENVLDSVQYGIAGTGHTGSYSPDFPDTENVLDTDTVDDTQGSLASCSADGDQDCVVNGSLYAADTSSVDAYDIRIGETLGGLAGKLKANCRNLVNSSVYNYDGDVSSIGQAAVTSGTVLDWWDTMDDENGVPSEVLTGWSNFDCNASDWQDTSIDGDDSGGDGNCNADEDDCQFYDKISKITWSELISSGMAWDSAVEYCHVTMNTTGNYAGDGPFGGATGWRIPTVKEMVAATVHGIKNLESTHFNSEMNEFYATSTHASGSTNYIWTPYLGYLRIVSRSMTAATTNLVCVRDGI